MTDREFLQALARAGRQFRTYPATSRLCTDAIEACHTAFASLRLEAPLVLRATGRELLVGDDPVASEPALDHDLREPLHAARVGSVEFDRHTSPRDLTHLCGILATAPRAGRGAPTVAERLLDAGVGAIVARMTPRPEVFDVGAAPAPVRRLVDAERTRQAAAAATGPAQHLFPPDKGWVRLDPAFDDATISLVDLTVLVSDPARLAGMLARLVDEAAPDSADQEPLAERYDDIVTLIRAVDPRLSRVLMAKLARAVLDLDSDRRRALLRRSVLPGLIDGRAEGEAILGEFPDVDLADALSLLLDLEAASPQLLLLAIDRLRLAPERRTRVMPMIQARTREGAVAHADRWSAAGLDAHAETLIAVDAGAPKSFAEFAAFDLSIDEHTTAALARSRETIAEADTADPWLRCALDLARLEPNPAVVEPLLSRAVPLLQAFVRAGQWPELTRWLARIGDTAGALEASRPDVASAMRQALTRFCDRDVLFEIARLCTTDGGAAVAPMIVAALGPSIVEPWLQAISSPGERGRVVPLRSVMCQCARHVGPAVAERLAALPPDAAAIAVGVLGFAGPGYEDRIASQVAEANERVAREALRALARVGTGKAAALIAWHVEHGAAAIQPAAEEALWRLPSRAALGKTRELLGRREFVTRYPQTAARLLDRAAHDGATDLGPVLEALASLRFHFWSPAIARVGARARDLL